MFEFCILLVCWISSLNEYLIEIPNVFTVLRIRFCVIGEKNDGNADADSHPVSQLVVQYHMMNILPEKRYTNSAKTILHCCLLYFFHLLLQKIKLDFYPCIRGSEWKRTVEFTNISWIMLTVLLFWWIKLLSRRIGVCFSGVYDAEATSIRTKWSAVCIYFLDEIYFSLLDENLVKLFDRQFVCIFVMCHTNVCCKNMAFILAET